MVEKYDVALLLATDNNQQMTVEKHRITFYNVTKKDAQVIQCNATNKWGYIYTNAYMNVQSTCALVSVHLHPSQKI